MLSASKSQKNKKVISVLFEYVAVLPPRVFLGFEVVMILRQEFIDGWSWM